MVAAAKQGTTGVHIYEYRQIVTLARWDAAVQSRIA
jgi:hypothetical protein